MHTLSQTVLRGLCLNLPQKSSQLTVFHSHITFSHLFHNSLFSIRRFISPDELTEDRQPSRETQSSHIAVQPPLARRAIPQ
jgi:hypothetical protein